MKRLLTPLVTFALALAATGPVSACHSYCRPATRANQGRTPINFPSQPIPPSPSGQQQFVPPPVPSPNGLSANDVIVNDLPADAKLAIRAAAAKVRTNSGVRQTVRTAR